MILTATISLKQEYIEIMKILFEQYKVDNPSALFKKLLVEKIEKHIEENNNDTLN
jgi:hypothetical protein